MLELESCITTGLRMTNSNAGFTGTEISPIGSAETLGKDGPACDFSVIRQKGESVNAVAAETIDKQSACQEPEKR